MQLRQQFPKSEGIGGYRVGGARSAKPKDIFRRWEDLTPQAIAETIGVPKGWGAAGGMERQTPSLIPANASPPSTFTFSRQGKDVDIPTMASFTLEDLLPHVDLSEQSKEDRILSEFFEQKLLEQAGKIPVHVVNNAELQKAFPQFSRPAGIHLADADGNTAILIGENTVSGFSTENSAARIIMHEGGHAISVRAILAYPELQAGLRQLMDIMDKSLQTAPELRKKFNYAFTDELEFYAEGVGNHEFRHAMMDTPIPEHLSKGLGLREPPRNLWDLFRNFMKDVWEKAFGKRPSDSVLDAFLKISEAIEEANKDLPGQKEIRGTESAIEEPELPGTRRMEDTPAFGKGSLTLRGIMNETRRQRYDRLIAQQQQEDLEFQQARVEREAKRRLSKEWKARSAALRPEVEQEVRSRPDVVVDEMLRTGNYGGEHIAGGLKLDAESLTDEQKASIPSRYVKDGGMTPDDVAGMVNPGMTGDQLVNQLAALHQARTASGKVGDAFVKELINNQLDLRLKQELGIPAERLLEEVKEHVLSPTQLDILSEELLGIAEAGG